MRLAQDPRDVTEILSMQMPHIYNCTLEDPRLLRMTFVLLTSSCQRQFASAVFLYVYQNKLETLKDLPHSKVSFLPPTPTFCIQQHSHQNCHLRWSSTKRRTILRVYRYSIRSKLCKYGTQIQVMYVYMYVLP